MNHQLVDKIAAHLSRPERCPADWPGQSLAEGAAGIALLHIELAATGHGGWQSVRASLKQATTQDISIGGNASLYFGAPALEFVLRAAAPHLPSIAQRALPQLQAATDEIVYNRLRNATARRIRGALPALAEFDLIRGLTGLGAVLLDRGPGTALLGDLLDYLVALTEPVRGSGDLLPGWWTTAAPVGHHAAEFESGHGNNGMAHGIAGPLALLALAMRQGSIVEGHRDAIERITAWLQRWPAGRTPYWVSEAERRADPLTRAAARPSWCYGALGVLRAQQLAALALGDNERRAAAEQAARTILTDPAIRNLTRDATLCHGWAGLLTTAAAIASDSPDPDVFSEPLQALAADIAAAPTLNKPGLLEGQAGVALALHALDSPPTTGWARALLIT
jgi:lantibiotic biosynthesis protein